MNPARRRDCDSDTASEKCTNSQGTSVSSSTIRLPPSVNAAQRRRSASPITGSRNSVATATEPLRPNTSAASRKWRSLETTSCDPYWAMPAARVLALGSCVSVSSTIGLSQSSTRPMGTRATSHARQYQNVTARSGTSTKTPYVGCVSVNAPKIATTAA